MRWATEYFKRAGHGLLTQEAGRQAQARASRMGDITRQQKLDAKPTGGSAPSPYSTVGLTPAIGPGW